MPPRFIAGNYKASLSSFRKSPKKKKKKNPKKMSNRELSSMFNKIQGLLCFQNTVHENGLPNTLMSSRGIARHAASLTKLSEHRSPGPVGQPERV